MQVKIYFKDSAVPEEEDVVRFFTEGQLVRFILTDMDAGSVWFPLVQIHKITVETKL